MRQDRGSALWGKKGGGSRPRLLLAAGAATIALVAPAAGQAGEIPAPLLERATADPNATFEVIIQSSDSPAGLEDAALAALTQREHQRLTDASDLSEKLQHLVSQLAQRADESEASAAVAKQRARKLALRAQATRRTSDRVAAATAKAEASRLAAAAAGLRKEAQTQRETLDKVQAGRQTAEEVLQAARARAQSQLKRRFEQLPVLVAEVTGAQVLDLKADDKILSVTPDAPVQLSGPSNPQAWVKAVGAEWFWLTKRQDVADKVPAIAIVDSGVDASRAADFGGRVLTQVTLTSLTPNSPGDGQGHGTMVASLAAGAADGHTGVSPDAKLVSLDVVNDNGEARTSDVIAAADWILRNRSRYNIRVANFSLHSALQSSFMYDPLDKAVERLWLNGVVVVAAAGNYATGGAASGVRFAPGNDPFVITVGAVDVGATPSTVNDVAAPWSAWGYTLDGFAKPELGAPGRYMIAACPGNSSIARKGGQNPSLVRSGYVQLSGTSFSAPIVSAAAAVLLAVHPDWGPDEVKGALMLTARRLPATVQNSVGVGELDLKAAVSLDGSPPNPNLALRSFVVSSSWGSPRFDSTSWMNAAKTNASWSSASWSSASWSSASWSSASWSSASWTSASWTSASWSSASWTSASWTSASWTSAALRDSLAILDNAEADTLDDTEADALDDTEGADSPDDAEADPLDESEADLPLEG